MSIYFFSIRGYFWGLLCVTMGMYGGDGRVEEKTDDDSTTIDDSFVIRTPSPVSPFATLEEELLEPRPNCPMRWVPCQRPVSAPPVLGRRYWRETTIESYGPVRLRVTMYHGVSGGLQKGD